MAMGRSPLACGSRRRWMAGHVGDHDQSPYGACRNHRAGCNSGINACRRRSIASRAVGKSSMRVHDVALVPVNRDATCRRGGAEVDSSSMTKGRGLGAELKAFVRLASSTDEARPFTINDGRVPSDAAQIDGTFCGVNRTGLAAARCRAAFAADDDAFVISNLLRWNGGLRLLALHARQAITSQLAPDWHQKRLAK